MPVNAEDLVGGLIQRHDAQIRRIVERRCGPAVLAHTAVEDIYQEVIVAAVAAASSFEYRDDARFIGWINTITRRTIARHAGSDAIGSVRLKREDSSGVGVFVSHLKAGGPTPSSAASREELRKRLRMAINSLPEDYRRAIMLYKMEERSLPEVAAAMGRSKVATCRLVARALAKLRKKLET